PLALEDICYVRDQEHPDRPRALRFPAGHGKVFKDDIANLKETLQSEIQNAFASEEYQRETKRLSDEFTRRRQEAVQESERFATERGFSLQMSQVGMAVIPVRDGQPMSQEQYMSLSDEERQKLESTRREVSEHVQNVMRQMQQVEKEQREQHQQLVRRIGEQAIEAPFQEMREKHDGRQDVRAFLDGLREYTLNNLESFASDDEDGGQSQQQQMATMQVTGRPPQNPFLPFEVNLYVDNSEQDRPPILFEQHPTYTNLFGRIERRAVFGTYVTDHTMLRAGALAEANGGYLVMQARDVLLNPGAWDGLKRVLRNGELKMEDPSELFSALVPQGLRPQPISVNTKVILTGDVYLYQMLSALDDDFWEVFKVRADFDYQMEATDRHLQGFGEFICGTVEENGLRHFKSDAVAAMAEHSSRMVAERGKLSTRFGILKDIVVEASYRAGRAGRQLVERADVLEAVEQRIYRSSLIADRIRELMVRGHLIVDMEGARVGQVNGLAVYDTGDVAFGKPGRITAQAYMGRQGVVNIEREARLSGSTHDKGVLIMSGYMGARYAQKNPMAVAISLAFEQSYGGVDGDSASSTELYAILSSLSGVPVKQSIAVTGSVNQMGDIQPIGGANEKIEGFYDLCREAGRLGEAGVMIPSKNVENLVLRPDVVESVERGEFHVYAVSNVDEGIEVLTGVPAGEKDSEGVYPEGTINRMVEDRLAEMARGMHGFLAAGDGQAQEQPPE
ncbi:MAG: Lon protease family protein, partial [Chloroflexota bacterium]